MSEVQNVPEGSILNSFPAEVGLGAAASGSDVKHAVNTDVRFDDFRVEAGVREVHGRSISGRQKVAFTRSLYKYLAFGHEHHKHIYA